MNSQSSSYKSKNQAQLEIIPMSSPIPRFRKDQVVIDTGGFHLLDENNSAVIYIENLLSESELDNYLNQAVQVERKSGRSGFGTKPRKEICYSPNGEPYVYSKIKHETTTYPQHVLDLINTAFVKINEVLEQNDRGYCPYIYYTSGVDILYDDSFPRGGSISAHKNDEENRGMVIIYSLDQTRYLRVRRDSDKQWYNMKAVHNSLIVMYGDRFQTDYTHQVDKLAPSAQIGARLSLNVRFMKAN